MNNKTVKSNTLKYNLCINCGICSVVCPNNAIKMVKDKFQELKPEIDTSKCNNCGLCKEYCIHTKEKFISNSKQICEYQDAVGYGLQNASYYVAWSKDIEQRQKSCSGGAVTELACYLMENKVIDGVMHVERLWAKRNDLHYGARLSKSVEEIKTHVSSAYQPIDFSNVLLKLEEGKTYLVTATPCVIRALNNLFSKHPRYKKINIITCALVCSHNTNAQFIDFLTEINKLDNDKEWQVNIRNKDNIVDANNFNNHIYTKEKDLLKQNRHETGWTKIWRSYYFAMNCCLYCSDFWGYGADISVKDAWGKWAVDPLGKSIVIVRNKRIEEYFLKSNIEYEFIDYDTVREHQLHTPVFKQQEAYNKISKSIFAKCNRRNSLFKYKIISKLSKLLYANFGFKITKNIVPIIEFLGERMRKL